MAKDVNTTKFIWCLWLSIATCLSFTSFSKSFADECSRQDASVSKPPFTPCSKDPSCVIVGETHILEWKSRTPSRIIVVCIHGLGLCAKAYKSLAQELCAAGIDGFGVNVRGFGPNREQAERAKLNCVETMNDVSNLLNTIHTTYPDYRVFLLGESMGGALAIRIACENPELVDGVVCSAPAWKLLKMRRAAVKGIFELVFFPGSNPGPAGRAVVRQVTSDSQLAEHWFNDPSHKLKLSFGEATSFLKFISKTDNYAEQLTKPVLIVQGLSDRLVCPKAVAKLFNSIPSSNKTFLIDGKGEHLVLEEARFSPALIEKLISWMKTNNAAQSVVEVINEQALSSKEERHLSTLLRLAKTGYTVKWAGDLKNVHQGKDFSGKIDLSSLAKIPHLYAVGPLENLQGEVTIFDGKPLVSRVKNQMVQVDNNLVGKACFLVYGQARNWKKIKVDNALNASQIESLVKRTATKNGIKKNIAFPFLIEGSAKHAHYHIMNRVESTLLISGSFSHEEAKVNFTLEDMPVQLLGFYSEQHQGIFTHQGSFVHIHIKTLDDKIAGHLDDIQLDSGAQLLLPIEYSY
jgi:acetolactate decarboxylase